MSTPSRKVARIVVDAGAREGARDNAAPRCARGKHDGRRFAAAEAAATNLWWAPPRPRIRGNLQTPRKARGLDYSARLRARPSRLRIDEQLGLLFFLLGFLIVFIDEVRNADPREAEAALRRKIEARQKFN